MVYIFPEANEDCRPLRQGQVPTWKEIRRSYFSQYPQDSTCITYFHGKYDLWVPARWIDAGPFQIEIEDLGIPENHPNYLLLKHFQEIFHTHNAVILKSYFRGTLLVQCAETLRTPQVGTNFDLRDMFTCQIHNNPKNYEGLIFFEFSKFPCPGNFCTKSNSKEFTNFLSRIINQSYRLIPILQEIMGNSITNLEGFIKSQFNVQIWNIKNSEHFFPIEHDHFLNFIKDNWQFLGPTFSALANFLKHEISNFQTISGLLSEARRHYSLADLALFKYKEVIFSRAKISQNLFDAHDIFMDPFLRFYGTTNIDRKRQRAFIEYLRITPISIFTGAKGRNCLDRMKMSISHESHLVDFEYLFSDK